MMRKTAASRVRADLVNVFMVGPWFFGVVGRVLFSFLVFSGAFGESFVVLFESECGGGVFAAALEGGFVAQLLETGETVGIEGAVGERGLDGAVGFGVVLAVAECAVGGEFADVFEGVDEAVEGIPEVKFAHSGGVDDDSAVG